MMAIKSGRHAARIHGIRAEIAFVMPDVHRTFDEFGAEAVVTSGIEGSHSRASLHYAGAAIDLRVRDVNGNDLPRLAAKLKQRLGDDFDVLLESDHIHVEWQPKKPYSKKEA
jgi:hypothetical protein